MSIKLGPVGHFAIAVSDVKRTERFWTENFDVKPIFRFEEGVGLSNDAVTIVPFKGEPNPEVIEHLSFHLKTMDELRSALDVLKKNGVEVEDPGDEIGPEASGSPHMGLWFHDPDGYRWELSVQNGALERDR
jgi:catechol 2,3-dioxygenase-like lactoylglutathione lyase family enzyme